MADIQSSEFMFKRIVNPGLDKIGHANRLGIRLKSTWMPKKSPRHNYQQPPKSSSQFRRKIPPNRLSSPQRPASVAQTNATEPEYIQDMVIPIASNVQIDEVNVQRSLSPGSFCSTTRFKQVPLPVVSARSSAKTPNHRPMSICSERYLSSVTPESRLAMASEIGNWNESDQSVRMEAGQKALDRCRMLKRTSEVKAYRVDRLYYMSAAPCNLHNRYDVDENELKMLRERSNSQMMKTPRLGSEYRPIAEERGQFQTPGDNYSRIERGAEDSEGHTFITQPGKDKELNGKGQTNRPRSNRSAASSHSGILQNEDENKSKKRVGSSKSVTFSEKNPGLEIVGKGTGDENEKESGVESGVDDVKIDESRSLINGDVGVTDSGVENMESGIDNSDVENSGAILESDNDKVDFVEDCIDNVETKDDYDANVEENHLEHEPDNNAVNGVENDTVETVENDNNETVENEEVFSSSEETAGQQTVESNEQTSARNEADGVDGELENDAGTHGGSSQVDEDANDKAGLDQEEVSNTDIDGEELVGDENGEQLNDKEARIQNEDITSVEPSDPNGDESGEALNDEEAQNEDIPVTNEEPSWPNGDDSEEILNDEEAQNEDVTNIEPSPPNGDKSGEVIVEDIDGDINDMHDSADAAPQVDNSVAADQVIVESDDPNETDDVQGQDGAEVIIEKRTVTVTTDATDVDALLKLI